MGDVVRFSIAARAPCYDATVSPITIDSMLGLFRLGSVVLRLGSEVPTPLEVELLQDTLADLVRERGGAALFARFPTGGGLPSPATRQRAAEMLRQLNDGLVGVAIEVRGSGLRASAIRGVMTGVSLVSRTSVPTLICAELGSAADWLSERVDGLCAREFAGTVGELAP